MAVSNSSSSYDSSYIFSDKDIKDYYICSYYFSVINISLINIGILQFLFLTVHTQNFLKIYYINLNTIKANSIFKRLKNYTKNKKDIPERKYFEIFAV